jgi:very-short-patch-repair endonuclease
MANTKTEPSKNVIPVSMFETCLINGLNRKEISLMYPLRTDGAYYLNKFILLLKDKFQISMREYCEKYLNVLWPKCPISGENVGFRVSGVGLILSKFKQGRISKEHSPRFRTFCEKMSVDRVGSGNPMFGASPWNTGLTKETSESVKKISDSRIGITFTKSCIEKMKLARARSNKKARHTVPHTAETKQKLRETTAMNWAKGIFNRKTSIEFKMEKFLQELNLKEIPVFQHQIKYFTVDFAFIESKIAIECQGTYFHIDPRVYPNGPEDSIQRRNFARDLNKRKYCCDRNGWRIIEIWETEINNGKFKDILLCKLKEYNLLKN